MQFFIIHHCVLIFIITFIFTTDPASADVCTVWGKLHQSVILPCKHDCYKVAKWTDVKTRFSFAQCDQTSCRSLQGYKMSHDQYLQGDLSLTITSDYNKRNTYVCECGDSDISIQSLRISTVFSTVQERPAEHLLLDLSVPEPVKVFYRSSDTDKDKDELICSVNQSSVQCEDKYTSRTSRHQLQLTLRGLGYSDSGTYTIRNTDYIEDIHVYSVSVTGLSNMMIVVVVVMVVLLVMLLVIIGVLIFRLREFERREEEICKFMRIRIESLNLETGREMKEMLFEEADEKMNQLKEDYKNNMIYSKSAELFCVRKKSELEKYKNIYLTNLLSTTPFNELQCDEQIERVKELIKKIESVNPSTAEGKKNMKNLKKQAEDKILQLNACRDEFYNYVHSTEEEIVQLERRKKEVEEEMMKIVLVKPDTEKNKMELNKLYEDTEKKINQMENDYINNKFQSGVKLFCKRKRSQLEDYKLMKEMDERYIYAKKVPSTEINYLFPVSFVSPRMEWMIKRVGMLFDMLTRDHPKQDVMKMHRSMELDLRREERWCRDQCEVVKEKHGDDTKVMNDWKALLDMYKQWCNIQYKIIMKQGAKFKSEETEQDRRINEVETNIKKPESEEHIYEDTAVVNIAGGEEQIPLKSSY